jgi:predicted ATPase/DNA-binding winged helix-turn-helix (wHTH) protein
MSEDHVFVFGSFRFLPRHQLLLREGRPVKLGCRAMDILHLLLKNAGEPVSKRALQKFVWPDTFVHESNLKVHIHSLRRALGEASPHTPYICTVAGRGYRFIQSVSIEPIAPTQLSCEVVPLIHSLPAQRTLIGRIDEIDRVANLLAARRLVTLVGPGGVGKTAVAVAVAHRMQRKFPDGTYFLDLSLTNDSAVVPNILAAMCGIRGHPADIVAAVAAYLGNRRVLILMDSCEHVLASVASIATRLQEAGVAACVLATSLEPLRLNTETVQLIEPLDYPPTSQVRPLEDALRYPAIELFATRASEWVDYQLTEGDVPAGATLCEKLDGLPLAIELAATQLDRYSPATLLESLDRRVGLLRNENPAAHRRHRTLWATLDWSYQLLSSSEAMIFRLVSLFAGTFAQEDVVAMAQVAGYNAYQTAVALGGLVTKSLVAAEVDEDSLRYRLLDCARVYAAEALSRDPLAVDARRRFAHFMLTTLERFAQERLSHVLTAKDLTPYKRRLNDLREALGWCFGSDGDSALGIEITVAAIPLWDELSLMLDEQLHVEQAIKYSASAACSANQRAQLASRKAWRSLNERAPEAWDDWILAVRFADEANDMDQRLRARWGQMAHFIMAGGYGESLLCLAAYRRLAAPHKNGVAVPEGERLGALAELHLGKLVVAREKFERFSREILLEGSGSVVRRYQVEPYTVIQNSLVVLTWLMGSPDRAALMATDTVEYLGRSGHLYAETYVLATGAIPISLWNGDIAGFERYTARLGASLVAGSTAWVPMHRFYRALSLHLRGEQIAVENMRVAVDQILATGFLMRVPFYLTLLADAFLRNGSLAEAERAVEEALSVHARSQEAFSFPDVLRVKAKVLEARGRQDLGEVVLQEALTKSIEMAACSLQLRVACDLADLWMRQGREEKAVELLGPVYGVFSEGHGTRDLQRASMLLASARQTASAG